MNKGGRVKSSERNIKSFPHSTLWPRAAHTQAFPSLRSEHHTPLLIHPYQLPQPITDQHCDPLLPSSCPQPMISSPSVDPAHFWCLCCVCLGSLGFLAIIILSFCCSAFHSSFLYHIVLRWGWEVVLGVLVLPICSDKLPYMASWFTRQPAPRAVLF